MLDEKSKCRFTTLLHYIQETSVDYTVETAAYLVSQWHKEHLETQVN